MVHRVMDESGGRNACVPASPVRVQHCWILNVVAVAACRGGSSGSAAATVLVTRALAFIHYLVYQLLFASVLL